MAGHADAATPMTTPATTPNPVPDPGHLFDNPFDGLCCIPGGRFTMVGHSGVPLTPEQVEDWYGPCTKILVAGTIGLRGVDGSLWTAIAGRP